ncbi:MAG: hypothetical protein BroJett011_17210 [Chloroflexota bacterium]|nr:MAG: hypothetical protein BroJett011_17210 [Chloroflexota bacterium]
MVFSQDNPQAVSQGKIHQGRYISGKSKRFTHRVLAGNLPPHLSEIIKGAAVQARHAQRLFHKIFDELLSQGAIIIGLLWGSPDFLIDGQLRQAMFFSFLAFCLSLVGLIHAPTWPDAFADDKGLPALNRAIGSFSTWRLETGRIELDRQLSPPAIRILKSPAKDGDGWDQERLQSSVTVTLPPTYL